ncbi:MAG: LuxR C-terminal-related transcriptional regulator [Rikenellaceae bacterium]
MKLYEVIEKNPSLIAVVQRFGIVPGYGKNSIKECADEIGLDFHTLLEVMNIYVNPDYFPSRIDEHVTLSSVVDYIDKSYRYLVDFQLYNLEKHLSPLLHDERLQPIAALFSKFKTLLEQTIAQEQKDEFPMLHQKSTHFNNLSAPHELLLEPNSQTANRKTLEMISDIKRAMLIHASGEMNINLFHAVIYALTNLEDEIAQLSQVKEKLLYPINKYIDKIIEDRTLSTHDQSKQLSKREEDVLKLIACGKLNKEIAGKLSISINTVLTHRKNIIGKLGIKTVSALTYYALVHNIVTKEEIKQ